jgi:tellurite resistance protein
MRSVDTRKRKILLMAIDHHAALIYTMVLVSAAEGQMSDAEIEAMTRLVNSLPVFEDFDRSRIDELGQACAELLRRDDGLDVAIDMIGEALPARLRETAYALACDVVAADGSASQNELRLLEMLRYRLDVERLVAAAIERGAQARHRRA